MNFYNYSSISIFNIVIFIHILFINFDLADSHYKYKQQLDIEISKYEIMGTWDEIEFR